MSKISRRWTGQGNKLGNRMAKRKERARRVLHSEQLESRVLLAGDLGINPYHNYNYEVDVDQDFIASPRDALLVLRAIESRGPGALLGGGSGDGGEGEDSADAAAHKFDTNGDAYLSPGDFLRVVNYLNSGEGAPGDVIEFELQVLDVNLNPLVNNTVQKGADFVLAAFVTDVRSFPTGVFAGFLDVGYTNPSNFSVVYSETQRIILPKDTTGGTFQLMLNGETTAPISLVGNATTITNNIRTAAQTLSGIGTGNVEVVRKPIFNEQTNEVENQFVFELKFVNARFEQDINQLCVPGGVITGNSSCVGAGTNVTTTSGVNTITIEEIAKGVATDSEAFRRSFTTGPDYPNGLTAEDGDRNPVDGSLINPNVFSEVGSFDGSGFPTDTEGDKRLLWRVRLNADEAGTVTFTGAPADTPVNSDVLVFGQEAAIPTSMIGYNGFDDLPITITIVADISAVNDSFIGANSVGEDSSNNTLSVLANDSTQQGTLTITGVTNISNGGTVNIINGGTQLSYSPALNFFGVETFNYSISNGVGGTATATVTVNVFEVNDAPTAGDDSKAATESTQLVFPLADLLVNDVVGPAVPAPNETVTQIFTNIVFSAGSRGGSISVANQGTPNVADDMVTYTPVAGVTGIETFTYTITDNGTTNGAADPLSDQATLTFNIGQVNDPPVANDDGPLSGTEDIVQNIPTATLLANDNAGDPGQTVTVVSVSPTSAEGGTVVLQGNTVVYTPPQDYFGIDTFTYTIDDNGVPVLSDSATVTIDLAPVNDPPIAADDLNIQVDELSSAADNPILVLVNDSPGPLEEAIDTITITLVTQPANGTAAINNNGTPGNPADDFITYQPDPEFVDGSDSFTYTITDGGNLTDTATVTVDVVPAVRPRTRNDNASMNEGAGPLTIDVLSDDLPNPGAMVTLLSFTQGTNGTVTRDDGGTAGDLTDDQLIYTPNDVNFNGSDSFTYTINDTAGTGSDSVGTVSVTVAPVNDAPTLNVPAGVSTNEDVAVAITGVSVDDIDKNFFVGAPFNLQVALSVANGRIGLASTAGLNFTVGGNNQASMTFRGTIAALNTALASLTYTPNLNTNGSDPLNITVNDLGNVGGAALSTPGSVPINVVAQNDAPILVTPGAQTVVRDTNLTFSTANNNRISVSDVDSDPNDLEMQLTVTNGTLSLATTAGLMFMGGANGSATMTIRGTQAELNAALNGLVFTPTPAFSGNASLTVDVSDLGNTGAGGEGEDSGTVPITVQNFLNSDLSGFVYLDKDNDRIVDANELVLANVTVRLTGTSLLNEIVNRTATTGINGQYMFTGVTPGNYQLQLDDNLDYLIDGRESVGLQGGQADDANDRIHSINIPQLGVGLNGGTGNNFAKLGLGAAYVSIIDTFASSTGEGILLATDRAGSQYWQSILGTAWAGVTNASATLSADLSTVTIQISTQSNGTQTRSFSTRDPHVRAALDQTNGAMIRIDGTPADLGFTLTAVAQGEGESSAPQNGQAHPHSPEVCDAEQYAAAVDRVLAEAQWS